MTKNDIINDVVCSLTMVLNQDQLDLVKSTFIVKMQGYEIYELCTLPSTEVKDNSFIYQRFITDKVAQGKQLSTIKAYLRQVKMFLDHANLNYRDVTAQDITDYFAYKRVTPNKYGKMNSQSHLANISKSLFVFFQWAYRRRHIDEDIMRDVDRIKQPLKKKDRISLEEIAACRHAISNIDKPKEDVTRNKQKKLEAQKKRKEALFELMISTGMRVGEIANLKIEDVNFEKQRIHIPKGKTENAVRNVICSIAARDAILRLIGERKSGYVFRPVKNSVEDDVAIGTGTLEQWAKEIGEAGECHCITTVHVYRKSYASEYYRKTKNVRNLAVLLGHSSSAVTEKYYLVDDMQEIEHQALQVA